MAEGDFIASIDIGSSKTVILLAELKNNRVEVFAYGRANSSGVRRGVIDNSKKVVQVIENIKQDITKNYNTSFENVSINISDPNLKTFNQSAHTNVPSSKVRQSELDAVIKIVESRVKIPQNYQTIHSITQHYTLDADPDPISQVIGKKADNLGVSMHIVSASNYHVEALETIVHQSKLGLSSIVPNSMASSEPCLTQDEKKRGICLIDIGSDVVDFSVFKQGGIVYSSTIDFGARQTTQDIAEAFNTSFQEAERLKVKYGQAKVDIYADKLIRFQQIDDSSYYYLSQESLSEVIKESYLKLFKRLRKALNDQNLYRSLKSGFVLVGGGAKIKHCDKLMSNLYKKKVKIGRIDTELISAKYEWLGPEYACVLGLLLFGLDESESRQQSSSKNTFLGKIGFDKGFKLL